MRRPQSVCNIEYYFWKYIAWFIVKDSQGKMKLKGDYTARQKRGKLLELSVYSVKYLVQNAWKSLYFTWRKKNTKLIANTVSNMPLMKILK